MAKKIVNSPDAAVSEMMEGYAAAFSRCYEKVPGVNGLAYRERRRGKVALVVGGGSGHEPLFSGFVGRGLADGAACGNIFASPDPGTICAVAKAVETGKGVLFVYGNYAGDNLNFDMAEEFLQDEGIKTGRVRVWDDCASAPPERTEDRRGIAGDVFCIKIAGAACDAGLSLEQVREVTEKARENLRSIGIATSPGQIPGNDKPTFELGEDEIEYGMGLHGEPGIERTTMKRADELVSVMYRNIIKDMPFLKRGDEVCALVNGLGSTTILEMGVVFRRLKQLLDADGIVLYDGDINRYCTCMEMGGFSISLLKLTPELKALYDAPCFSPFYAKGG
jgi:dihydroxyacetone kinase-like protein